MLLWMAARPCRQPLFLNPMQDDFNGGQCGTKRAALISNRRYLQMGAKAAPKLTGMALALGGLLGVIIPFIRPGGLVVEPLERRG